MKCSLVVLLLVLLVGVASFGQTLFCVSGDFSGTAVLWFTKTTVTAQLTGALSLSGVLPVEGEAYPLWQKGRLLELERETLRLFLAWRG